MLSSKNEEMTFLHGFSFVFIHFVGTILLKKLQKQGVGKKIKRWVGHIGGLVCKREGTGGSNFMQNMLKDYIFI